MMVQSRRRPDPPPSPWEWLSQLVSVWPFILFIGALIVATVTMELTLVSLQKQVTVITTRQDSSVKRADARDYMTCHMFEIIVGMKRDTASIRLPKRCDDVFQSMGYR